jgi:hypothetical protein
MEGWMRRDAHLRAMDPGSHAPSSDAPQWPDQEGAAASVGPRLELTEAATELLTIIGFVSGDDGPLQVTPDRDDLSPWHHRALEKALERLEVIDHYLRGRVAFFIAGKDHGYGPFVGQLELAGAALTTCRATVRVVDALLAGRRPAEAELGAMTAAGLELYPALKAFEEDDC